MNDGNKTLKELTLTLLYLCSWQERGSEERHSWKGYDFDILNELSNENADALNPYGLPKKEKKLHRNSLKNIILISETSVSNLTTV
jgi:hypothetical protein